MRVLYECLVQLELALNAKHPNLIFLKKSSQTEGMDMFLFSDREDQVDFTSFQYILLGD